MSVTSIAPNVTAVFDQTPVQSIELVPIGITSLALAVIVVSLRLYTRHFLTKRLWWDDAIVVVALLSCMGLSIDVYYAKTYGWGHHAADIPSEPKYIIGILVTLFVSELLLTFSGGLIKCSILFYYLRITSGGAHSTLRNASIITLVLIAIWTVAMTIVICVQCVPTSVFWAVLDYTERDKACKPWAAKLPFFLGQGITNTVGDFVVVLLPMKHIFALRIPMRQKAVVVALLLLGILASILGILRMWYIAQSFKTADTTWGGIITFELTTLEINTAIICCSVPAIKPLAIAVFPRFGSGESRLPSAESNRSSQNVAAKPDLNLFTMVEEEAGVQHGKSEHTNSNSITSS